MTTNNGTPRRGSTLLMILLLLGLARLAYDEYWLRELMLQVRADTAFERDLAGLCRRDPPGEK